MDRLSELLKRVADGDIDPEEAARLLDEMDAPQGQPPSERGVRDVKVCCEVGTLTVVGDPEVREALAEGPHKARVKGETLVIEGDIDLSGFSFSRTGIGLRRQAKRASKLWVRVNPELPLRVEVATGSATVRNVTGPISAKVSAGKLSIEGFSSPIDLEVEAGTVDASGRLRSGTSRVRCELGTVDLELHAGSSVKINARSELGRISLPGQQDGSRRLIGGDSAVLGAGEATLDIKTALGRVSVREGGGG